MGALSSWAMLAVTHHMIVQLAYQNSNLNRGLFGPEGPEGKWRLDAFWYDNYELLGDDIVIFDEAVATEYLKIMEKLGVGINLQKSVIAVNPTFEFAKVTGMNGLDVSALSWKAFMSQNTFMGRVNIFYSLLERGICSDHWVSWFARVTKKLRSEQGDTSFTLLALWTMFASSGKISYAKVFQSLYNLDKPAQKFYKAILLNCNLEFIRLSISNILSGKEVPNRDSPAFKKHWNIEGA